MNSILLYLLVYSIPFWLSCCHPYKPPYYPPPRVLVTLLKFLIIFFYTAWSHYDPLQFLSDSSDSFTISRLNLLLFFPWWFTCVSVHADLTFVLIVALMVLLSHHSAHPRMSDVPLDPEPILRNNYFFMPIPLCSVWSPCDTFHLFYNNSTIHL